MSSTEKNVLIPGNFKLGKELFTSALLNNQNEIRTRFAKMRLYFRDALACNCFEAPHSSASLHLIQNMDETPASVSIQS